MLAETEVMEMAKRKIPGVWTYGFYDGWVPNYLMWISTTHNLFGRFYEVQSYGPEIVNNLQLAPSVTSREWYRPNPPLPSIKWGPRNNTNIQESALLIAMHKVAQDRELYLENYWMKSQRAIEKGREGPIYGWWIPANQRRKADAADMVNHLRQQGSRIASRRRVVQSRQTGCCARRLPDSRRSALPNPGRHVLLRAELSGGQSASL